MSQVISVDLVTAAKLSDDVPRGYTDEGLNTALLQYEKFLMLAAKNRSERLVPTKEIDMMWHLHMLHPRAYYNDCMDLFGDILDHNGGYGLRPDEPEGLAVASDVTMKLWEQEFDESYLGDTVSCRAGKVTDVASCMADGETLSPVKQLASCAFASCLSEGQGNFPGVIRA